jgi:hypothetical protein
LSVHRTRDRQGFFPDTRLVRRLLTVLALVLVAGAAGAPAATQSFRSRIEPIPATYRLTSWHAGCPVARRDLRLVTVSHWGFDRRAHTGRLVVAASGAPAVVRALHTLYDARFPIRRMELVESYGSDDDRSMAADNTSAFNCRLVEGSTSWSAHAYGRAIDINPVENPYLRSGQVLPPAGRAYLDRRRWHTGMIHPGDRVVRAFAAVGWSWGGAWHSPVDYQHFSATGG